MRLRHSVPVLLSCLLTAAPMPGVAHDQSVETFSRDISLSEGDSVRSIESISGSVALQQGSHVLGNVETERGDLTLEQGAEVGGKLKNDSGTITVDGARVLRGIVTTNGDIYIGPDSVVKGGILVHKRNVAGLALGPLQIGVPIGRSTPPMVVIAPGATVEGKLRFKREVQLYVGEGAKIGPVEGAEPIYFTGPTPGSSDTHLCPEQSGLST